MHLSIVLGGTLGGRHNQSEAAEVGGLGVGVELGQEFAATGVEVDGGEEWPRACRRNTSEFQ